MNRPLLITAGITIILTVLGVWLYLIFYGAPEQPGEIFANLGFERTPQPTTITPPIANDTPSIDALVDTKDGKLRQLTTRPIAGFGIANNASSTLVRYAEKGTGHIYEIDLTTGVETIISRTTTPQTVEAHFSEDATVVALTAYDHYTTRVFVGEIKDERISGITLEPGAENIAFDSNSAVLYSIVRSGVTTGYRHNLITSTRAEVFTFNFGELDVTWGNDITDTYLTTKPSPNLESFIYKINQGTVTPVIEPGYGLSALINNGTIVTTKKVGDTYVSEAWKDTIATDLPTLTLKEKCTFSSGNTDYLWCAASADTPEGDYIDNWYKGVTIADDYLWFVSISKQTAELIASPKQLISMSLDITNLQANVNDTQLFFKNRTDQTLWQYDLTN
jgi:hypothetical protein